jgi:hypothetical protein
MSKRIHLVGAGGVAGIGMTRCLNYGFANQDGKQLNLYDYAVQGHDTGPFGEYVQEALSERDESLHYCDLVIPIPDAAVSKYADHAHTFLPDRAQIELCQEKAKAAEVLGDLAPKTYWLRDSIGAGGKGAQMISEYLPGRNFSVEFAFYQDKLIGRFQKERLSYLVKEVEPMVTASGSSAVSVCTDEHAVTTIANLALLKITEETDTPLHGFYGVDLRMDENGVPKVTEINAGRLLTASYTYFYSTTYNLALAGIKAALGEPYELGEYPIGWGVIRTMDKLPSLFPPEITKRWYGKR